MCVQKLPSQKSSSSPATAPEKLADGAVMNSAKELVCV
jgi:hypothetical protein